MVNWRRFCSEGAKHARAGREPGVGSQIGDTTMSQTGKQPQRLESLGRYRNLVLLGQGGMGAVYRAEDPALERTVAIKVVLEDNDEYLQRFRREARAIAKLSHPNIVQVFDFGEDDDGHPYFVMELISGQSLDRLLEQRGPLPPGQAADLLRQAAEGLAVAHADGIVHRDVKPHNLILSQPKNEASGAPRLKIVDFGVARLVEAKEALTSAQATVGTLHYMAPEALSGGPVDARADLYALGLVGFYLLTGRAPFNAPSAVAVAMKQLNEPLPDLAKEAPGTPASLRQLIARMAEKDRDKRIQSATEVGRIAGEIAADLRGKDTLGVAATQSAGEDLPSTLRQTISSPQGRRVMLLAGGLGLLAATGLAVGLGKRGVLPRKVVVQVSGPGDPALPKLLPEPPVKPTPVPTPTPAGVPAQKTGPVRVAMMPFKHVGDGAELAFMTAGLAATAEADVFPALGGRFMLLDRASLDGGALAELERQYTTKIDGKDGFAAERKVNLGALNGAEVLVSGTYQVAAQKMRTSVRLIRVETGELLDATSLTVPYTKAADGLDVQDRVAALIREHLLAIHPKLRG